MQLAILSVAAPILLAGVSFAQSFNVDVGTFNPVPAATFGAAAAQPGTWNQVGALIVGGSTPLVNLSGAATGVTMTLTAGGPPALFDFNNAGTAGDDELLMDDAVDPGTVINAVYTFSGLAAGTYDVITYAWAPDNAAYLSNVSVNGLPSQLVGGAWSAGYTLGVTHALHTVTITAGQNIVMTMFEQVSFATFNGIQLKQTMAFTESFAYGPASGSVAGMNGGTGFPGAWAGNGAIGYDPAGLSFSNLVVSGGKASWTGTNGGTSVYRDLTGSVSGTVFGSFLSRGQFNGWNAGSQLSFVNATAFPSQDSERYSFAVPQFNNGDLKVSAHGDAGFPIGCVPFAPPPAASGAQLLEETYLTLYKIDAVTKTATAWVLNASQFGVIKAGGITEAELNAAGLGSASNQIWARATQTESSACPITGNRLDLALSLSGAVAVTASIDELRIATTGFDDVTPVQPVTSFCSGDAVGTTCLGCGNNGAAGRGCANSVFAAGALLTNTGLASVGNDTLVLACSDMPGPGLFFQANGTGAPINFGDGMLCAAVGIIRMGVVFPTMSVGSYPGGLTPNPISVSGGPITAGQTKHYQVWYRDNPVFCTAATFNTSNGLSLTWLQ